MKQLISALLLCVPLLSAAADWETLAPGRVKVTSGSLAPGASVSGTVDGAERVLLGYNTNVREDRLPVKNHGDVSLRQTNGNGVAVGMYGAGTWFSSPDGRITYVLHNDSTVAVSYLIWKGGAK